VRWPRLGDLARSKSRPADKTCAVGRRRRPRLVDNSVQRRATGRLDDASCPVPNIGRRRSLAFLRQRSAVSIWFARRPARPIVDLTRQPMASALSLSHLMYALAASLTYSNPVLIAITAFAGMVSVVPEKNDNNWSLDWRGTSCGRPGGLRFCPRAWRTTRATIIALALPNTTASFGRRSLAAPCFKNPRRPKVDAGVAGRDKRRQRM